jgi:hypothetical protein
MNWLNANIHHFALPMGMLLGLFSAVYGFIGMKKRKAGAPRPYMSETVRNSMLVVIVVSAVLLGFAIAKIV